MRQSDVAEFVSPDVFVTFLGKCLVHFDEKMVSRRSAVHQQPQPQTQTPESTPSSHQPPPGPRPSYQPSYHRERERERDDRDRERRNQNGDRCREYTSADFAQRMAANYLCLHGPVFIEKVRLPPKHLIESHNERGLKSAAIVKKESRMINVLGKIAQRAAGLEKINNKFTKKYSRKLGAQIVPPVPCDIFLHRCFLEDLLGVRCVLQLLCVLKTHAQGDVMKWFRFYENEQFSTFTGMRDKMHEGVLRVCL